MAVHPDVLEISLLSDDKCNLSELGGKEKTVGAAECVLRSSGTDISKEWKRLGIPALVSGRKSCTCNVGKCLDLQFNCLLLWVILGNLDEREP